MYILVPCVARAKWMILYWWHQPVATMWAEMVAHTFIKYGATIRLIKIVKFGKSFYRQFNAIVFSQRIYSSNLNISLQVKQTLYL